MPKRITQGNNVSIEFTPQELANLCNVHEQDLQNWHEVIPPTIEGEQTVYRFDAKDEMRIIRHRLAVLRTGMTVEQIKAIESKGEKMLAGYAALAQDAPAGITAHVWRSYAVVVYDQIRYGKMLTADELAIRAGGHLDAVDALTGEVKPSAELAATHLRLLQAAGALTWTQEGWGHQGLPLCLQARPKN